MSETTSSADDLLPILSQFCIEGAYQGCEPHHRGHIHDTFISTWQVHGAPRRYLHQRMNDKVFVDIPLLMHNVERISRHLQAKLGGDGHLDGFRILQLVPTQQGAFWLPHAGGPWRTYFYVEGTSSYDHCQSEEQAHEAARAFGWFQAQLTDLDVGELYETLPWFFSSPWRYEQLAGVLVQDAKEWPDRLAKAAPQIEFATARREMVDVIEKQLQMGQMPRRIVHGDTKLNNILFDDQTGKARCIVDLDTCMPGYSLYDFGDLVRFAAATSDEDEVDLSKAGVDLKIYRALVEGYLEATGRFLTPNEVELMPFAARLVTFTIGLRFLADFLAGDKYFKVCREEQNLDRAKVQFKMVEIMEERQVEMAVSVVVD